MIECAHVKNKVSGIDEELSELITIGSFTRLGSPWDFVWVIHCGRLCDEAGNLRDFHEFVQKQVFNLNIRMEYLGFFVSKIFEAVEGCFVSYYEETLKGLIICASRSYLEV